MSLKVTSLAFKPAKGLRIFPFIPCFLGLRHVQNSDGRTGALSFERYFLCLVQKHCGEAALHQEANCF